MAPLSAYRSQYKRIKDMTRLIKSVRGELEQPVSIAVIAEPQVEAEMLSRLGLTGPESTVFGLSSLADEKLTDSKIKSADLAMVVISAKTPNETLERMVKQARLAKKRLVIVTGSKTGEDLINRLADVFRVSGEDVIFVPDADTHALENVLVPRIVGKIEGKEIALAAAVPLFKEEVAQRIISQTANQNALIGAMVFIPGADMPILTANQVKMILRLSAVYNQELSAKRLYEVLAVVAGGFAFREAARQALSFIPVAGWAVKGAVAYAGTVALGRVAKKYFEDILKPEGESVGLSDTEKGESVDSLAANREGTAKGREAESLY